MKRLIFIFVVILISFSLDSSAVLNCPVGASFRLDRYQNTPMSETGHWEVISYHRDVYSNPVWGQSQCWGVGTECHLYDWFTWWFPELTVEPDPPNGGPYDTEYPNTAPVGYDPAIGEYQY